MSVASSYRTPVIICIIAAVCAGVCVTVGFVVGRYAARTNFKKMLDERAQSATLAPVAKSRAQGKLAVAYLRPSEFLEHADNISWNVPMVAAPFVGSVPRPGKSHNSYVNTMLFRNRREITVPKPHNEYRIFVTGGSTAFGVGAPSQDTTIGGILEALVNRRFSADTGMQYRVFTGANPAWASTHERIMIENRISELEPDLVISFSGTNDVHWGARGRNVLWFRTYEDELFWTLLNGARRLTGYDSMPDVVTVSAEPTSPDLVAKRLAKNVCLAAQALRPSDTPYVFVLQPNWYVTHGSHAGPDEDRTSVDYFNRCYSRMREAMGSVKVENFTFVDLSSLFDVSVDKSLIYLDSYHFGDRGNAIVAEAILKSIGPVMYGPYGKVAAAHPESDSLNGLQALTASPSR
jgi:hypothetical protein